MMRLFLCLAVCLGAIPALAAPLSDAARLRTLSSRFTRPTVWVLPVLDQRALDGTPATAPHGVWHDFVEALAQYKNLSVSRPAKTTASIAASSAYRSALPLARQRARRGMTDYQQVRLKQAATALGDAVRAFKAIGHHLVAPGEVGRVELTRGLALLEADARGADDALRHALLIDPTLRLRKGVDRAEAVEALERARLALASALPSAEALLVRPPAAGRVATVQARLTENQIEIVVHEGGRVTIDRQSLDAPDAGPRLAARIWSCLPFGRGTRRPRSTQRLYLDAGFDSFTFTESPTELYRNVGVTLNASWSVARFLAFDANLALTNSGRDREEDLRSDVPVGRLVTGPSFVSQLGRLRLSASVGIELASIAPVTITSNPNCKYFRQGEAPAELCNPRDDFERHDLSWAVGGALTLGATLLASKRIYLGVRARGSTYIFQSVDNGLDRPVGGQFVLGYQLF